MAGLLYFGSRGRLPVIRQTEAAECGLACLAMISSYHGHRIDLNTLRRRHPVSLKGVTLRALIQVASQMDLACRPLRFELGQLRQLHLPTIVHWDMNHFLVLRSVTRRGIVVHDPASGERFFPIAEASKHLSGVRTRALAIRRFSPQGRESTAAVFDILDPAARQHTRARPNLDPLRYPRSLCDCKPVLPPAHDR